jgi:hypothetical protein
LHEVWVELKYTLADVIESKDEQVKQIRLITGGKADCWSMDDPNSGRGRKYRRAIIDEAEKSRHFKEAWEQTIRPTLVDFQGDAWFCSTPQFGQTYFKEIFQYPQKYDNWMSWRFTSFDNPYLRPEEIEEARKYDDLVFRCEYLAEDVDITLRPFAYAFQESKHVGECEKDKSLELILSFDFNVDPITCIVAQIDGFKIRIIKEYRLESSDIYEMCDRIKADWRNDLFLITGDATGANRSALTRGNINYYDVIKAKLGLIDTQMRQPSANPSVSNTRVLVNSLLQNSDILIDKRCIYTIRDLKYVQVDNEGNIIKDRKSDIRESDFLDTFRYLCYTFCSNFLRL